MDNRKFPDELQLLQDPTSTALLLMMRGVKSVAITTITGTPHTHMELAIALMKLLANSTASAIITGTGSLSSRSLSAAVWAAQRGDGLSGFELAALSSGAAMVVYGAVDGVVAEGGDGMGSRRAAGRAGPAAASSGGAGR
jgi:hypothetical protein